MGTFVQSKAVRAFPLVALGIALIFDVWAMVGGVALLSTSVAGGLAVLLAALVLFGMISWRIGFRWKRLRERD